MLVVDRSALAAIWLYQRFLSRRKGYRCAYSLLHGGTGCSGYVKHAIRDHGMRGAMPVIRARFHDCRLAATELCQKRRIAQGTDARPGAGAEQNGDDPESDSLRDRRERGCCARTEKRATDCEMGCDSLRGVGDCFGLAGKWFCGPRPKASGCDCTPDGCDCVPSCD